MNKPMLSRRTYALLRGYEKALDTLIIAHQTSAPIDGLEGDIKIARGSLIDHLRKLERRILINPCRDHTTAAIYTGRDLQWRCRVCCSVLMTEEIHE